VNKNKLGYAKPLPALYNTQYGTVSTSLPDEMIENPLDDVIFEARLPIGGE
jgi:hypothetical protein